MKSDCLCGCECQKPCVSILQLIQEQKDELDKEQKED